jgi:hypothetical protein
MKGSRQPHKYVYEIKRNRCIVVSCRIMTITNHPGRITNTLIHSSTQHEILQSEKRIRWERVLKSIYTINVVVGKVMSRKRNEIETEVPRASSAWYDRLTNLRPLSSESSSELKVLGLDSYSLSVDSGEIG